VIVSIIIPVYNAADTIVDMVEQLTTAFEENHMLEIVLVNDCSTDDSENSCLSAQKLHPDSVTYLKLARNFGEHNAVMAGLNQSTGDYVVTMDDDLQNPPIEALNLVREAIRGQYDVVYSQYGEKKHSISRNIGSWFNGKVANWMLRKPPDLYLCSFRAMSRFIVNEVIKYDLPYPYVDGLILRSTSNIGTLKTRHEQRTGGESGYTFRKLVRLWLNMFTTFSVLPLRIATLMGFTFAFLGMGVGVFTLFEKWQNPDLPVGWATIAVLSGVMAGVQLMAIGMIGEYLGRLFLGSNKQPQFVVRERHLRKPPVNS
jgi:glycosyltransferase involved in cell wall biosynthesis